MSKNILRKIVPVVAILLLAFCITSCGEKKELICDSCGKTVEVAADSNMTDEWILFCKECGEPEIDFGTDK